MPSGSVAGLLWSNDADGAAITNTTTQASLLLAGDRYLLPGGFLDKIGKKLRIRAAGRISCVVTTPGTLLFEVRMGPTSTIAVAVSQQINLNIVAKTNVTWKLEWDLRLLTKGGGTSATFMHTGSWQSEAHVGAPANTAGGTGEQLIPASAPAAGTGFDSSVGNTIDLQAKFSVATATTSIQLHDFELWSLN